MLYQTIEELLSTSENLTLLRNNVRNDDSTDTVAGVDWFLFKGVIARNVYVSGNGWMNFGVNAEGGLKVNRRDQAMWFLWREVGNIWNESYKFLRIRWRGYSQYNTTNAANLLDFDVVLCSTGDIVLRISTWPTAAADGYSRLEAAANVTFKPAQATKEFTFMHQDESGNSFTLEPGIVEVFKDRYVVKYSPGSGYGTMKDQYIYCGESMPLRPNTFVKADMTFIGWDTSPDAQTVIYTDGQSVTDIADEGEEITLYAVWRKKWAWLIGDAAGNVYTVTQDDASKAQSRQALSGISALTAETFYTHGFQFQPDSSVLVDLPSPRIWKWDDSQAPSLRADVEAVPLVPQLVVFSTMTLSRSVKYINIAGDDNALWNVSFDNGATWFKYENAWVQVTEAEDGCLKRKLEILTASDWAAKVNGTLKFRCWMAADSWVKRIRVDY